MYIVQMCQDCIYGDDMSLFECSILCTINFVTVQDVKYMDRCFVSFSQIFMCAFNFCNYLQPNAPLFQVQAILLTQEGFTIDKH